MIPISKFIEIGKHGLKGLKFFKAPDRVVELIEKGYDEKTAIEMAYLEAGVAITLCAASAKGVNAAAITSGSAIGFEIGIGTGPFGAAIGSAIGAGIAVATANYAAWKLFYECAKKLSEEIYKDGLPNYNDGIDLSKIPTEISSIKNTKELFITAANTKPIVIDPILIDLNGDGIKTTTVENGLYFDHENDGFKEKSAWVDENDGIIVFDKNNDGIINNGNEVFGDSYVKNDGTIATSGFDALSDLDSNNDGIINSNDELCRLGLDLTKLNAA